MRKLAAELGSTMHRGPQDVVSSDPVVTGDDSRWLRSNPNLRGLAGAVSPAD